MTPTLPLITIYRAACLASGALLLSLGSCSTNSDDGECAAGDAQCASGNQFGNASMPPSDPGVPRDLTQHGDAGLLTPTNNCGLDLSWATLKPLNMFVMFDRSGSMLDDDKWDDATAALTSFFEQPGAAELRVALRFFPHDEPESGCNDDDCDADACSRPLVELGPLLAERAPADAQEAALLEAIAESAPEEGTGQGTPIYAALDGALRWAADEQGARPDETLVVVFVTDGRANGCEEDIDRITELAADALSSDSIRTYAIGLEGSEESEMDQLAAEGGTGEGIFIGSGADAEAELLAALDAIRGQNLSCDFPVPPAVSSGDRTADLDEVSVTFVYGSGQSPTALGRVADEGSCGGELAWYYDDPSDPRRIFLCGDACDTARSEQDTGLQILIGCDTPQTMHCAEDPEAAGCTVD